MGLGRVAVYPTFISLVDYCLSICFYASRLRWPYCCPEASTWSANRWPSLYSYRCELTYIYFLSLCNNRIIPPFGILSLWFTITGDLPYTVTHAKSPTPTSFFCAITQLFSRSLGILLDSQSFEISPPFSPQHLTRENMRLYSSILEHKYSIQNLPLDASLI